MQLEFPWANDGAGTAKAPVRKTPNRTKACSGERTVMPKKPDKAAPKSVATSVMNPLREAAEILHRELIERTGLRLRLHITNNRSTMMAMRPDHRIGGVRLRLHLMFLKAPEEVRAALATWILHPRSRAAGAVLNRFIREQRVQVKPAARRPVRLRTRGQHFDLKRLFDEVNAQFFEGGITASITWGNMPTTSRRRSIRFGSYIAEDNVIRIHPLLDQDFVPAFFIRYIVFHEMLHAFLGIEESPSGRRLVHPPKFRKIEKSYPDYERAAAWCADEANLRRFLRGRPHAGKG